MTPHNQRRQSTDHSQHTRTTKTTGKDKVNTGYDTTQRLEQLSSLQQMDQDIHQSTHLSLTELQSLTTTLEKFRNAKMTGQSWATQHYHFNGKGTTRFTVKKDYEYIQENHDEEQQHEHHEAHRARGLRQPQQPTPQQIAEHNLTHLPYRNWCPICVQGKGRQDNYKKQQSRQPVIQVDFAYIKSQQDPKTTPVLTAVDVTTQLCMAVLVPDKASMMDYMVNNLQAFIFECGRTQGILQSDNEDTLNALLKATAAKVGTMSVRHSPSYSSNSQGSVERLYRTLLGQIRVVKAQVESNYSMTMSTKHCLLPWIVRHAAWTVNRYVIHSDGYTSFERRWGRNYERAICEFGETLLYLPPQHKKLPNLKDPLSLKIASQKFRLQSCAESKFL